MRAPGRRCHGRGTCHGTGVGRRTARHAAAFGQPPRGHPMTTTSDVQPDLTQPNRRFAAVPDFGNGLSAYSWLPAAPASSGITTSASRRRCPPGRLPPSRSRGETARPGRRRGAAQYRRRSARARQRDAAQHRHREQPASKASSRACSSRRASRKGGRTARRDRPRPFQVQLTQANGQLAATRRSSRTPASTSRRYRTLVAQD